MSDRLDQLRSFIWWTTPLYGVFAGIGLLETHFTMTLALIVLFAVLAAFGLFDGLILASLGSLRMRAVQAPQDLPSVQRYLERLSRAVLVGGGALSAAALVTLVVLSLTAT